MGVWVKVKVGVEFFEWSLDNGRVNEEYNVVLYCVGKKRRITTLSKILDVLYKQATVNFEKIQHIIYLDPDFIKWLTNILQMAYIL